MAKKQQKPATASRSDIRAQLRQAIRDSGLSLYELGRRTGIDSGRLSRFMREERDLTLAAAAKILDLLGLQMSQARRKAGKADSGTGSPQDTEAAS